MTDSSGDDLLSALKKAVEIFRREGVPYALIGAWALSVWGRPRATQDLDFMVMVDEENLLRLGEEMSDQGMEIDHKWMESNPMVRSQQIRLRYRGFQIDVLRPRDSHDHQSFNRLRKKRFDNHFFQVLSPEDFILGKLKVGRPRDFEDVLSVLKQSRKRIDFGYLSEWALKLGIREEVDYVLGLSG